MIEITQIGSADVIHQLPEAVPWQPTSDAEAFGDLLICCGGFEDRCLAIVSDLATKSAKIGLLIVYPTNEAANANAIANFSESKIAESWKTLSYSRHTFLQELRQKVVECNLEADARIIIDLSGMASYVIYRVLSFLFELAPQARLAVYYAEADNYSPTEEEWNSFYESVTDPSDNLAMAERYEETHFQSRGVDETYDSEVFPGLNVGPLPTSIIAVPNFSLQRMKTMLSHLESQYSVPKGGTMWFLGLPPDKAKNGWRFDALALLYNVSTDGLGVSTRDYRNVLDILDAIWEKSYRDKHLVIAPLGSKMQHLGVYLFLAMHPECGLVLCEPSEFLTEQYTTGIGPRWWLDLGVIGEVSALLQRRGCLEFNW